MKNKKRILISLGFNDIEKKLLETGADEGAKILHISAARLGEEIDAALRDGILLWIPWRVWKRLPEEQKQAVNKKGHVHKILILDKTHEGPDLEQAMAQGFSDVVVSPLSREKIAESLKKASDVHDLFDDIMRMTREISLEREILARKADAWMFLNRIMTRAVESLNPVTILNNAREDLNLLLPVRAMQGIFWQKTGRKAVEAEIFLAFHKDPAIQDKWLELHLDKAKTISGRQVRGFQLTYLMDSESGDEVADLRPEENKTVALPLKAGGEHFGCLTLLTGSPPRLTKDQSEVLRSATNHLGLALKNALLFRETKIRADYDGLTRIHNRQYFDDRLAEELSRQQRYQHDLSLMLLDLDHFKNINDNYGHQAGDIVLKEVGQLLLEGIRATDFAARYGGEEFVVILPHISEHQARYLAERLSRKISSKKFNHQGQKFNVTVSVGVASLDSSSTESGQEFIRRADQALYQAKALGRNKVVTYSDFAAGVEEQTASEV